MRARHIACAASAALVAASVYGQAIVMRNFTGTCKYPDGTKVHEGVIRVFDSTGKELLNGKTNSKGEFSFKVPKQDDLKIVLEAGMGHRAEWPLSKQDLAP